MQKTALDAQALERRFQAQTCKEGADLAKSCFNSGPNLFSSGSLAALGMRCQIGGSNIQTRMDGRKKRGG